MNILYLTNHLNIGGISRYVLTLSSGLKKRGHRVYVASSGGELLSTFLKEGIIYIPIPIKTKQEVGPKVLRSLFALLSPIKEKGIDVIHANTRVTQVLGCVLQRCTHRQFVSTCHGFFKKRFFRRVFPCWGNKVIAISQAVKEHLKRDFGVREEDIRVIHNGVDIEKFQIQDAQSAVQAKRRFGLSQGPVVGIVARLSEVKGHTYLIAAMKEVLEKIPSCQLLIIGEGKIEQKLKAFARNLGIEKSIFFAPSVQDTKEALSAMDLFALPSLEEGLGLSLMEAMASGLAAIGSDVGGISSLIRHEYTGLLVKPKDPQGIAAAILALLRDPKKRRFLGENARSLIEENFSQEKMVQETERVYLECLNDGKY